MTVQTWMDEFVRNREKRTSLVRAIEDVRQKVSGLLPSNLVRHGLRLESVRGWPCLVDDETEESFTNMSSCALCQLFGGSCMKCHKVLHRLDCIEHLSQIHWCVGTSMFSQFKKDLNPQPIIDFLDDLLEGDELQTICREHNL